jgi:hypothetical protein
MTRCLVLACVLLCPCPPATAQDMPLSQILIDGEGWKKVGGKPEKPRSVDPEEVFGSNSTEGPNPFLTAAVRAPAGDAVYFTGTEARHILAMRANAKHVIGHRTGADGSIHVGGLAADKDGRIYAATKIGVQVFDPAGRLCSVLTPAAPGEPECLAFEGDQLTHWIGDTKYSRRLNTAGAK